MRLSSFIRHGQPALGLRRDADTMIDLTAAGHGTDMAALIAAGVPRADEKHAFPVGEIEGWLPPVTRPGKLICIGLNYRLHAEETNMPIPEYPVVFTRFPGSVVGHEQPLVLPKASEQFDYEAEMAVVIGKAGRHIDRARALDHVFGYSVFNDGSIRDYQFKSPQWTMGKNFDASGAFGPEIVTADELPAGGAGLRIRTVIDGETVQDSHTGDLIFPVAELIATLSEVMTLEPGDVIATGTPSGVAVGRTPPRWLKAGETCTVEIEGIGTLSNQIVAE